LLIFTIVTQVLQFLTGGFHVVKSRLLASRSCVFHVCCSRKRVGSGARYTDWSARAAARAPPHQGWLFACRITQGRAGAANIATGPAGWQLWFGCIHALLLDGPLFAGLSLIAWRTWA
jgi:hypothetical protein